MKPADLALVRTPSSPTLSPDGATIAVAVTRIDLEEDEYRSAIWLLPADGSSRGHQFTRGTKDSSPRFSPDGRWLAFLRAGKDEPPQLHVMPSDGGEPRRVGEHPLGIQEFVWSPDSTAIAYIARVPEEGRYERGDKARPPAKEAPRHITTLRYRYDNIGFILDRPSQLFVVDALAEDAAPKQLTHESWQFTSPTWSPDGRWLVVATPWTADELSLAGDLYVVAAQGGDLRRLTRSATTVGPSAFSASGDVVYYLATDELDVAGRTHGLFRVPFDGSAVPERLTDNEVDLSDSHAAPRLLATDDGLVTLMASRGAVEVVRLSYDGGTPAVLAEGSHMVTDVCVSSGVVAAVVARDVSAGEVAVLDGDSWRVLSDFGGELARTVALRPMEELTTSAPDGYAVHGWLVKPAGAGPHPVLLAIHGGPATQYGHSLFDEAQVYAGAGYAVVLGNPRGASGYGEKHSRSIVGDMGNLDRADLMALLDEALSDPSLDRSRVGVMGGSYGGFMTTWLASHEGSRRFKAGISERAVNAWDSFTGSSDIGWFFTRFYCGESADAVRQQDPLAHADGIDIPMLIVHSENDFRCPLEQAQRLFVALKLRGVETEFLLFPGEGHELSRSGLPSHRVARFDAILSWWQRHLGA